MQTRNKKKIIKNNTEINTSNDQEIINKETKTQSQVKKKIKKSPKNLNLIIVNDE